MSATFLTYLWHYLIARTLYDQLLHPILRGHLAVLLLVAGVGAAGFLAGRSTRGRVKRGRT